MKKPTVETRIRLGAAAVLAAVFGGGIAVGFALDRGIAQATPDPEARAEAVRDAPPPPNGWIIDRLDLSAEQRQQVDSVVDYYGDRMGEIQKEYRPRFRAMVDSTDHALRALLTEEQLARYDDLESEAQRRRARGGRR